MTRGSTTLRPTSTVIPLTLSLTLSFTGINWVNTKCYWKTLQIIMMYVEEPNLICLGGKYFKGVRQLSTRVVFNAMAVTPNTSFSFLFWLIVKPQELALSPLYRQNSILWCMIWNCRKKNYCTS